MEAETEAVEAKPHRLFDLKSNLAKNFCPFPNVN